MDQSRQSRRRKASGVHEMNAQDNPPEEPGSQSRTTFASTIRPVTPEFIPEEDVSKPSHSREPASVASPPTSPRSSSREVHRNAIQRAFVPRSNSHNAEFGPRNFRDGLRDGQTRPRTRTMEERSTRDRSPSNLLITNRHRIGSVHSTSSSSYHQIDEPIISSIGHPSTVSPTSFSAQGSASTRTRLTKNPPRQGSPLPLATPSTQPDSWVAPVPASDARKILRLMKTTRGRMQGMLAFRRGDSHTWSLAYCYINEESGSLVYEPKNDNTYHRTLVPDLRGCRVQSGWDLESYTAYIDVTIHNSGMEIHLRPPTQEEFDSWFAALFCWNPIHPKGMQNKKAKPQAPPVTERRLLDSRRHSEISLLREAPIIKVGKMIYWDTTTTTFSTVSTAKTSARPPNHRTHSQGSRRWRKVSCTLRENGELKLYADMDVTLVSTVQLSQLSRCAVQRLDPSVLDNDFCIAIYPQYTSTSTSMSLMRPIFLSLESRVLYEVWIVLLRAFTIPQLYGPEQPLTSNGGDSSPALPSSTQDMFRMERSLTVRVIEAKLNPPMSPKFSDQNINSRFTGSQPPLQGGYYSEVLLDGETRARTAVKGEGTSPFWREEFEFYDLPAVLSTCSLVLKRRPPNQSKLESPSSHSHSHLHREAAKATQELSEGTGGFPNATFDHTVGKVDIYLDDLESNQPVEKWWPLNNMYGNAVGEILIRVQAEEVVILMARDYQPLSELLHRFSNSLTPQISQMIPNQLNRLSECLLNIFQVSGQAGEWIRSLIEDEIDGTLKETPVSRLRFSRRIGSGESGETFNSDRELIVRDMGHSAKIEANLLFRGNTLLTKALDLHMKRLGKEYLEDTLADKIKELNDKDPECEVDPSKVQSSHELEKNWKRLLNWTEDIWKAIFNSSPRCPTELRLIFRHVRACAEDRYGDFLRTVSYSSVSGFLFLRFFCPAVLNPQMFGLLKDHPKSKARRTLTLIAKSLQGLANMSTFGSKEHWMEPANAFLTNHRQQFKEFLDTICSIPSSTTIASPMPPSYSTPLAILQRLPPTSREGFPSLPYLIDHARSFAALVSLWLENTKNTASNLTQADGDLWKLHNLCVSLNQRTQDCLARAERAERPSSSLSVKWEDMLEQLETSMAIDSSKRKLKQQQHQQQQQRQQQQQQNQQQQQQPHPLQQDLHNRTDDDDGSSSTASTPITMAPSRLPKQRTYSSGSSQQQSVIGSAPTASSRFTPSSAATYISASASASAAEDTPPGSASGWDDRESSTSRLATTARSGKGGHSRNAPGSSSGMRANVAGSVDDSDEDDTTALPIFTDSGRDRDGNRDKAAIGLRGIVPSFKKRRG